MKRCLSFLLVSVILATIYIPVQAKKMLEECYHCQMSGTFYCQSCHNKGELTCDVCGGTGGSKCVDCDGTGYVVCTSCHGDTYIRNGEGEIPIDAKPGTCGNCGGTGKVRCITCHTIPGWNICDRCDGKKVMECQSHNCQAAKAVGWKCPYCLGTGYMHLVYWEDGETPINDGVYNVPEIGDDVQRLDHSWYVYVRRNLKIPMNPKIRPSQANLNRASLSRREDIIF